MLARKDDFRTGKWFDTDENIESLQNQIYDLISIL